MQNTTDTLKQILKQALQGSRYDTQKFETMSPASSFEELGVDSLDMVEFFLRVQDEYKYQIKREDFSGLVSLATLEAYLEDHGAIRETGEQPLSVE